MISQRKLSLIFALLAAVTLFFGLRATTLDSYGTLLLVLTPFFAVLALATGITGSKKHRD
ncbi:MAG: hypothetical protein KJO35_00420 [Gammaproteobacteria bacterium]|nr:hypothetical protein [Gammaproteobacteria bacterium]NNF66760.1 hypothetical protein [Gammaproteobacteria bacterium]